MITLHYIRLFTFVNTKKHIRYLHLYITFVSNFYICKFAKENIKHYLCKQINNLFHLLMKDRIIQIMQKEGLSNAEFAEKIGISTSSLSHIFNGRNKPSLDVVMRIHKACPYVNIEWLLYGEGEMEGENTPDTTTPQYPQGFENPEKSTESPILFDFRKENVSETPAYTPKESVREEIRYIEKPHPKITEIRIFFDNGTYQVFKPEKN